MGRFRRITGEDLHRALDVIDDLLFNDRLRSTSRLLSKSLQAVGLSLPDNLAQWPAIMDLLSEVRGTPRPLPSTRV